MNDYLWYMEKVRYLLDTPSLRIAYDAANNWLYNQWLGEHDAASAKCGADAICVCLHAQPCTKVLSDHSLLLGSWKEASPLAKQQTFSRLAAHGVAYFAWVYSPIYTDRVAMEQSLLYTAVPTVVIFDNLADAYDWLLRCPSGPAATSQV